MTTAVLLAFANGGKEFVRDAHVHGLRDGMLLIATGAPGTGLDAEVSHTVPVADLAFAETCEQDESVEDDTESSSWSMSWPNA
jgi:hypothetical protein